MQYINERNTLRCSWLVCRVVSIKSDEATEATFKESPRRTPIHPFMFSAGQPCSAVWLGISLENH